MNHNSPIQAASAAALVDQMRSIPQEREKPVALGSGARRRIDPRNTGLFADRAGRRRAYHRTRVDRDGRISSLRLFTCFPTTASRGATSLRRLRSRCARCSRFRSPTFIKFRRSAVTRNNTCGSRPHGRSSSCSSSAHRSSPRPAIRFSRVWLGCFFVFGLASLVAFRKALNVTVRRWTEQGHLTLRTVIVGGGELRGVCHQRTQAAEKSRHPDHRPVRRPRRRPQRQRDGAGSASSASSTISSSSAAARASTW